MLDDVKVPVPARADGLGELERVVLEVGEGILGQRFEPLPSRANCATCDYRVVCPAAAV